MQFIPVCLFTLIFCYSLVISAPVNQTTSDTPEIKQQKATAIASRLLKELAGEHTKHESSTNDNSQDTIIPVNHLQTEKVESHINNNNNDDDDDEDDEDVADGIEYIPTLDDLYEIYANQYVPLSDDDDDDDFSSEHNDDEYILPANKQQLLRYLDDLQDSDEYLPQMMHTPVMDDTVMTAEEHQQQRRRRRRSVY